MTSSRCRAVLTRIPSFTAVSFHCGHGRPPPAGHRTGAIAAGACARRKSPGTCHATVCSFQRPTRRNTRLLAYLNGPESITLTTNEGNDAYASFCAMDARRDAAWRKPGHTLLHAFSPTGRTLA